MLLCAAMICSAAARTDACEARSSATSSSEASGTAARISSTAAAAFFWLRTAITTCAPFAARSLAVTRSFLASKFTELPQWVWVLDSDVVVSKPDALEQAVGRAEEAGAAVVGESWWDDDT